MALAIRRDRTPTALRPWARRARNPRAALQAFAIANALEGVSRADAARLAGMERQGFRQCSRQRLCAMLVRPIIGPFSTGRLDGHAVH